MWKNRMKHLLLFVCIVVFLLSASLLSWQHVQRVQEEKALKQLAQTKQSAQRAAKASKPVILEQYDELSRQNADMIGWIKIAGTEINYPVMYTGDDFYLNHGFDKEVSKSGLPFIDKRCTVKPLGTNTIIYGHNMKNDTMFSELLNYKRPDYYAKHPIIHFDMLDEAQEYEIVAAFESKVYQKSDHVFKPYNFLHADSQADFDAYISEIKALSLSLYDTGIYPKYGDELITLMTCAYHTENGRFVVVARKHK